MYTLKVIDANGECIRWFTGTRAQVDQLRGMWLLVFNTKGMRLEVEPPMPVKVLLC